MTVEDTVQVAPERPAWPHLSTRPASIVNDEMWRGYGRLPLDLMVTAPLPSMPLDELMALEPGALLTSATRVSDEVTLRVGDVFLANVALEPAGSVLAARINDFAPTRVKAPWRRPGMPQSVDLQRDSVKKHSETEALEPESSNAAPTEAAPLSGGSDTLQSIRVQMALCFGTRRLMLQEALQWIEGDLVTLDQGLRSPFQILVKDRVVGEGALIIVEGAYALRLTRRAQGTGSLPMRFG
jgi:flagellar motor switch protein FliN/FliY